MYIGLHASARYSCPIVTKLESSSADFRQNNQMSNCIQIRPVGAELFHADGQTDMTKLTVAFRNANAPKNRVLEQKSKWKKAETYSYTSTIFYPTTRIATSLTMLRVMTGIATIAAIPVYGKPGSTPFTAAYYSSY